MDLATKAQGIWLIVLILVIGILGVLMLAGLALARGRYMARVRARKQPAGAPQDLWKISGERLSSDDTTNDDEEKPINEDDPDEQPSHG